jgi:hypothetical protein
MGYVGNQQTEGYSQVPAKQDLTGATGTSLTLTHAVASAEGIDLFINNVRQEPTTAYSVGGDGVTVTLTGSVVATDDIYVVYNSLARQTSTHPSNQALQATSGTFSSGISATTGTFSGAVSSTDLTLSGGLYVGGTGSANYLDDYEEGTWTPTVTGESGTINSYTAISATYTKVGDTVYVFCRFQVTDKGTGTNFVVSGLPFAGARELLGLFSETNTTGLTGFMFTAGTGATSFTSRRADGWGNNCLVNGSYSVNMTYRV